MRIAGNVLVVAAAMLIMATVSWVWLAEGSGVAYGLPMRLIAEATIMLVLAYAIGQAGFALRRRGTTQYNQWTLRIHRWLGSALLVGLFLASVECLAKPGLVIDGINTDDVYYEAFSFWIDRRMRQNPQGAGKQVYADAEGEDLPPDVMERLQATYPTVMFVRHNDRPYPTPPYIVGPAEEVDRHISVQRMEIPFWRVATVRIGIGPCGGT